MGAMGAMIERPRLSIVIPSHDTKQLTLACLGSLAAAGLAGRTDCDIVLVDDGSEDGTAEAVTARFPQVHILRNAEARGFTAAANRGLAEARGEILLLLNSDTEVTAEGLAALEARFAADSELGVAGAALRYPDGSPQWSGGEAPSLAWLWALSSGLPALLAKVPLYRRLLPVSAAAGSASVDWVTGAAMALRRAVWEAVGPLDEEYVFYGQDLDFCVSARKAGWKIEVLADFPVLHHHGVTIGRAEGAMGRQQPEILWTDLLRWARKHRGPRWAKAAARALAWGGRLRLAGRALHALTLPKEQRPAYQSDTAALRRAVEAAGRQPGPRRGTTPPP